MRRLSERLPVSERLIQPSEARALRAETKPRRPDHPPRWKQPELRC